MAASSEVESVTPDAAYRYWAFISYSHKDEKWAKWLHKNLETYRGHTKLAGSLNRYGQPVPKRIFPVFRDRDEVPGSPDLSATIAQALQASRFLIVLCSPNSAKSIYVDREIRQFKSLGRDRQVLALIVAGEPHASERPQLGEEECFPEALKFAVGPDEELTSERAEPIAADARAGKDDKHDALLKILAGILGVGFDELKQRDQARRMRILAAVSAGALAGLVVFAGLATVAYLQRNEAMRQSQIALARQLAAQSELARTDPARIRESLDLATRAMGLLEEQGVRSFDVDSALRRSLALTPREARQGLQLPGEVVHLALIDEAGLVSVVRRPDGTGKTGLALVPLALREGGSAGPAREIAGKLDAAATGDDFLAVEADGQARIVDVRTGDVVAVVDPNETLLAIDARGSLLAVEEDDRVEILEARTGRPLGMVAHPKPPGADHSSALTASFSPDGANIAIAYEFTEGHKRRFGGSGVWSVGTGKAGLWALDVATFVKFGARGTLFRANHTELQWAKGQDAGRIPGAESDGPFAVSPDERHVATSAEGVVRLWTTDNAQEVWRLDLGGAPVALRFSANGDWLATGGKSGVVKFWRTDRDTSHSQGVHMPEVTGGDAGGVLLVSADEKLLATIAHKDAAAVPQAAAGIGAKSSPYVSLFRVFELASGKPQSKVLSLRGVVNQAAFSADGRLLVTATEVYEPTLYVWDIATAQPLAQFKIPNARVEELAVSPDGGAVGFRLGDGRLSLWWWQQQRTSEVGGRTEDFAFDPRGDRLAFIRDGSVWLWGYTGEAKPALHFGLAGYPMRELSFSPAGEFLATETADDRIWVWEMATGQRVGLVEELPGDGDLGFNHEGTRLTRTFNHAVRSTPWDVAELLAQACSRLAALGDDAGGKEGPATIAAAHPCRRYRTEQASAR